MIHYIHCHQGFDLNKGGTVGYLSSLLDGMEKLGSFTTPKGIANAFLFPDILPHERMPNQFLEVLKSNTPYPEAYAEHPEFESKYVDKYQSWFHATLPSSELVKINLAKIGSVHIHGAYNFLPVYNYLRLCGLQDEVVKILTTHNPGKPELEDLALARKNNMPAKELEAFEHYLKIRDHHAFNLADALLFPSKFSMEGYFSSWPEFKKISKAKKIYFTTTGTEKKTVTIPRSGVRQGCGIPDNAIVFLYIGRFIEIRGFDLLVEAAKTILSERADVYFVVVGEQRKLPAVEHPNWIELPYTESPGDYLNMADACICANRGSFFDLSMIECLSLGIPMIAARVGGYKYLENRTSGITYFEVGSASGLAKALSTFCGNAKKRARYKSDNLSLYEKEFTPALFAQGYLDTVDQVYDDFSIKNTRRTIVRAPIFVEIEKKESIVPNPSPPKPAAPPPAPASGKPANKSGLEFTLEQRYKSSPQWKKVLSLLVLDRGRLKKNIRNKYKKGIMPIVAKLIPN